MLTRNFIRYLYGCSDWNNARGNRQNASVKELNGDEYTAPINQQSSYWLRIYTTEPSNERGTFWLVLGDDSTAVTADDYKLGNEITGLTPLAGDYIFNLDSSNGKIRIYRTFANNTDSDINVSEVGLVVRASTNAGDKNILIAREVLDSKIVIKSGGVQVFGIDIG